MKLKIFQLALTQKTNYTLEVKQCLSGCYSQRGY